jgi:hypothetical protein
VLNLHVASLTARTVKSTNQTRHVRNTDTAGTPCFAIHTTQQPSSSRACYLAQRIAANKSSTQRKQLETAVRVLRHLFGSQQAIHTHSNPLKHAKALKVRHDSHITNLASPQRNTPGKADIKLSSFNTT